MLVHDFNNSLRAKPIMLIIKDLNLLEHDSHVQYKTVYIQPKNSEDL